MIEADGVDDHEIRQVVFVRHIIAVPSDDIERRVILCCLEKGSLELGDYCVIFYVAVFKPSGWGEKVTWIGQSVCPATNLRYKHEEKSNKFSYPIGPKSGSLK